MEHRLLDALVDCRPEPLRDDAADDLVHELVTLVTGPRLEHDLAVAELPASAGLLLVAGPRTRLGANRLQIRDAWLRELHVDPEAAMQTLDGDFHVHLREAGEQLLARALVSPQHQRRILLGEPAQRRCGLVLVALCLRRDGEAHHGLREVDLRELDGALGLEQQVARLRLLELRDRADVALRELALRRVLLSLQQQELAEALLRMGAHVRERRVGLDRPLQHAEQGDAAGEGIGDGLEDERRGPTAVDLDRRAALGRRGNALDEQVEQRVGAEVLRGHAAHHGEDLASRDGVLQCVRDLVDAELLALEVALHQPLVRLHDGVEQLHAVLGHTCPRARPGSPRAYPPFRPRGSRKPSCAGGRRCPSARARLRSAGTRRRSESRTAPAAVRARGRSRRARGRACSRR